MQNPYVPQVVRIKQVLNEAPNVKSLHLDLNSEWNFLPGQFVEVSFFGGGEVPLSIASGPEERTLKLTFRKVGSVTSKLFELRKGDFVGIRGPFGNSFPLEGLEKREIVLIAGGIGIVPLRSLLKYFISQKNFPSSRIYFLYGARTPEDLIYKNELSFWRKKINLLLAVDEPDSAWKEEVGVVTRLLDKIKFQNAIAFICGPEIMMRFTVEKLLRKGLSPSDIILSLERYMKCGIGKCGHCYIGDKFVCQDGPIFSYQELNQLKPAEVL